MTERTIKPGIGLAFDLLHAGRVAAHAKANSRGRLDRKRAAEKKALEAKQRDRPPTKAEWTIERAGQQVQVMGSKGLPYRLFQRGDEIWIDAAAWKGRRFKVRNHIPDARFVLLEKVRDGKAHLVVRRER